MGYVTSYRVEGMRRGEGWGWMYNVSPCCDMSAGARPLVHLHPRFLASMGLFQKQKHTVCHSSTYCPLPSPDLSLLTAPLSLPVKRIAHNDAQCTPTPTHKKTYCQTNMTFKYSVHMSNSLHIQTRIVSSKTPQFSQFSKQMGLGYSTLHAFNI